MGDHEKLIKQAIELHYWDRPKVVADAMQLIQNYISKDQTDFEYDEILKNLHDLLDDLPSNILLYFFTIVPLPKQKSGMNSTFFELMKNSRASLLDNMQAALTEYINNETNIVLINNEKSEEKKQTSCHFNENNTTKNIECVKHSCESLLNICSEFVICKLQELNQLYDLKNDYVWKLMKSNTYNQDKLSEIYKYIEDINLKRKWLRLIEAGYFPMKSIKEIYVDEVTLLKERHLDIITDDEVFTISKELQDAIRNCLYD